jgi:hypothetical protein
MQYRPNQISVGKRVVYACLALLLLAWGTFGVLRDDLLYPGKWNSKLHLTGLSAWIMYGAMICASLVLLSVILDHYDKRNNERSYHIFAQRFQNWALWLWGIAMIVHVFTVIYGAI